MFLLEGGGIVQIGQTPLYQGPWLSTSVSLSRSCRIIENVLDNPIQTAAPAAFWSRRGAASTHTRSVVRPPVAMRYVAPRSNKVP